MSELLSVRQVAEAAGITEVRLRRLIRLGRVAAVRVGYHVLVKRAELPRITRIVSARARPPQQNSTGR